MKQRIAALILALGLTAGLAACGNNSGGGSSNPGSSSSDNSGISSSQPPEAQSYCFRSHRTPRQIRC